ncbi:MAG TPA: ubiquinol-cytochrome c reductase iron-sulfur subunit [Candidatus Binatia bacterium]|nr:ubiquinol-cytochrome c reductase iron-sulfur subunit [Candidatus Binatia bacterium]
MPSDVSGADRPTRGAPHGTAEGVGRRRLLNWFLGTSFGALLAAMLYPVARFLNPPEVETAATNEADAGAANDPEFVEKGYKIVRFGSEPVIVVRVSETSFRAFTAVCTHLACIVEYSKSKQRIECNCHNGQFNLQGQVIGGPPPRPLTPFDVHLVSQSGADAPHVIVSRA